LPIPATRRGLEMVDGSVQREASRIAPQFSARVGDELTIKSFRVGDSNVGVLLGKNEPPPKKKLRNPFAGPKESRINVRFSHKLSSKELTIENLNRFLAQAIDVTPLASPTVENNSPSSAASHERTESQPVQNPKLTAGEQPLPVLNTVAD